MLHYENMFWFNQVSLLAFLFAIINNNVMNFLYISLCEIKGILLLKVWWRRRDKFIHGKEMVWGNVCRSSHQVWLIYYMKSCFREEQDLMGEKF